MLVRRAIAAFVFLSLVACSVLRLAPREDAAAIIEPQKSSQPQVPANLFVNAALSMLGQPYRYGGAAVGGFDCSGLVEFAAHRANLAVPRTALEQLGIGVPVPRGELKAGDLVFMHLIRKELHVGIALDADRFIHAPSTGRFVRISSLLNSPYNKAYFTARRILASDAATTPLPLTPLAPITPLSPLGGRH